MAMDLLGAAGMTNGMKQFYSRLLLERALPNFVHNKFGLMGGIPRNGGRSIEWRRYTRPSAATTALTEGTPPSETQLTIANVQATVNQYGAFTRHSEVLTLQNFDPYIAQVSEVYGEQMGDTLDILTRNVIVAGTTVQIANTAASRGAVGGTTAHRLTYAEIREAVATLEAADGRPFPDFGNKFVGIIHPHTKQVMFGDSDIINSFQNAYPRDGSNPLISGEIGDFYGVRWFVTSNARIFGSEGASGASVYATMILGRQYYGVVDYEAIGARVIVKPVGSAGALDPLDQMGTIGWKAAHAAARLNDAFAVRIEHTGGRTEGV